MIFHYTSLVFLVLSFVLLAISFLFLWRYIKGGTQGVLSQPVNDNRDLTKLEDRFNQKIDLAMSMITSQGNLLSSFITTNGNGLRDANSREIQIEKDAETVSLYNMNISSQESREPGVIPHVRFEDIERKLETLLSSADFTDAVWQKFSRPFDACAESLISYLGENGLPLPLIVPYPELKDQNPNFWTYMIVQAQNWKTDGKRFLIPRNFDRYEPVRHEHLFDVRGNTNKPDNYIIGLTRCATLSNGILNGYIDKKLVETKGIISVE